MEKQKNIWMISCIIAIVVIICLVAYIIINPKPKEQATTEDNQSTSVSQKVESNSTEVDAKYAETFRDIRINEDFSTDGKIEGIENVRWNSARIMQNDGKMEVDIMINNESKDEKIEAKTLNVKLLDKAGKVIAEKDVQMKEIPANYGYTSLDMEFDMKDINIVYDIQISVK